MSSTVQKMKFSTKDFLSKCGQIRSFLQDTATFTEEIHNDKFVQCIQLQNFAKQQIKITLLGWQLSSSKYLLVSKTP